MRDVDIVEEIQTLLKEMVGVGLIIIPAPSNELDFIVEQKLEAQQKVLLEKYKLLMEILYAGIGKEFLKQYQITHGNDKKPGADEVAAAVSYISTSILGQDSMVMIQQINQRLELSENTVFIVNMSCLGDKDLEEDLKKDSEKDRTVIFPKKLRHPEFLKWLKDSSQELSKKHANVLLKIKEMIEISKKIKNKIDSISAGGGGNALFLSSRNDASNSLDTFVDILEYIRNLMLKGEILPAQAESEIGKAVKQLLCSSGISEMCDHRRSVVRAAFNDIKGKTPEKVLLLADCIRVSGLNLEDIPESSLPKMLKKALMRLESAAPIKMKSK